MAAQAIAFGPEHGSAFGELAKAAVIVRDVKGHVVGFNHAAEDISGYSFAEVQDKPIWDWLLPVDAVERAKSTFDRVLRVGEVDDDESVWVCKDNSRRRTIWSHLALRAPNGLPVRVVSTGADITARKRDEYERRAGAGLLLSECARLKQSIAELERSNEDLSQFAYVAAHDLQEPLRTVASYSQILHQKYAGKLDADADRFLSFMMEGATRMRVLIEGLLQYAQVCGLPQGETISADANAVLDIAVTNLATAIKESCAEIVCDRLPTLAVSQTHLLQLFQNIVGNAIKYRSLEHPRIKIWAEPDDEGWKIWIQDNGIGIQPKYLELVFGFLERLHTASAYAGAGLGLATCRKIVDCYGGRIGVHSEEGHGAAFWFVLPSGERNSAG